MLKLLKNLKIKEWGMVLMCTVFIAGQVWLDLKLPGYMAEITTALSNGTIQMSDVWLTGGLMLLCAFGSALLAIATGFFAAKISAILSMRLRGQVFNKIAGFGHSEINKFSTASLITRSTNDVSHVQMFIAMGLQVLIKAPIMATWAIITILGKSWEWSLATGVAVAVLLVVIVCLLLFVLPKFKKIQKQTDDVNRVARENLNGLRVVRAYNAEQFQSNKFDEVNTNLTKTSQFVDRAFAIMNPVMTLVMNGLALAIYWIGAFLINGQLAGLASATTEAEIEAVFDGASVLFGDMVVFMTYAMQVVMSFMMLIMVFIMMPRAMVSARRINEVLNTEVSIKDGDGDINTDLKGVVEFRNVSFKYPNAEEYVLENVSFKAAQGQTIAFIGSTGSGKSTLVNLIPRFFDATEGEVLINGVNVKEYTLDSLYDKIGYISQQAKLFTGTITDNITFGKVNGKKPTEKDIENALEISQSKEFVSKLDDKEKSNISQSGANISGGQKQRLSIARAIARNPEIFIFDDTFSALDYKTDKKLRNAIKKQLSSSTCLIVAQRIGTIKNADEIIVLEGGKVVGQGKHKDLLENCKVYQEIALSQLSQEELE